MARFTLLILMLAMAATALSPACGSSDNDDDNNDNNDGTNSDNDDLDDDGGSAHEWTDPDEECASLLEEESYEPCRNCVIQCNLAAENMKDLSEGPCLAEQIMEGWACDVVHSPSTPADDLKDNQCAQYPSIVPHLVEVTPNCRFVQAQ